MLLSLYIFIQLVFLGYGLTQNNHCAESNTLVQCTDFYFSSGRVDTLQVVEVRPDYEEDYLELFSSVSFSSYGRSSVAAFSSLDYYIQISGKQGDSNAVFLRGSAALEESSGVSVLGVASELPEAEFLLFSAPKCDSTASSMMFVNILSDSSSSLFVLTPDNECKVIDMTGVKTQGPNAAPLSYCQTLSAGGHTFLWRVFSDEYCSSMVASSSHSTGEGSVYCVATGSSSTSSDFSLDCMSLTSDYPDVKTGSSPDGTKKMIRNSVIGASVTGATVILMLVSLLWWRRVVKEGDVVLFATADYGRGDKKRKKRSKVAVGGLKTTKHQFGLVVRLSKGLYFQPLKRVYRTGVPVSMWTADERAGVTEIRTANSSSTSLSPESSVKEFSKVLPLDPSNLTPVKAKGKKREQTAGKLNIELTVDSTLDPVPMCIGEGCVPWGSTVLVFKHIRKSFIATSKNVDEGVTKQTEDGDDDVLSPLLIYLENVTSTHIQMSKGLHRRHSQHPRDEDEDGRSVDSASSGGSSSFGGGLCDWLNNVLSRGNKVRGDVAESESQRLVGKEKKMGPGVAQTFEIRDKVMLKKVTCGILNYYDQRLAAASKLEEQARRKKEAEAVQMQEAKEEEMRRKAVSPQIEVNRAAISRLQSLQSFGSDGRATPERRQSTMKAAEEKQLSLKPSARRMSSMQPKLFVRRESSLGGATSFANKTPALGDGNSFEIQPPATNSLDTLKLKEMDSLGSQDNLDDTVPMEAASPSPIKASLFQSDASRRGTVLKQASCEVTGRKDNEPSSLEDRRRSRAHSVLRYSHTMNVETDGGRATRMSFLKPSKSMAREEKDFGVGGVELNDFLEDENDLSRDENNISRDEDEVRLMEDEVRLVEDSVSSAGGSLVSRPRKMTSFMEEAEEEI